MNVKIDVLVNGTKIKATFDDNMFIETDPASLEQLIALFQKAIKCARELSPSRDWGDDK